MEKAKTEKEAKTKKSDAKKEKDGKGMIAVVRVKGSVNLTKERKNTLERLNLTRVNHCTILPDNSSSRGMLKEAMDHLTWGEVDSETLEKLVYKRGRKIGDKRIEKEGAKKIAADIAKSGSKGVKEIKPIFRLSPPSKGYKNTRRFFPKGDLGNRGKEINVLLKKMI